MQNDYEGRIQFQEIETFYASGLRGPEQRADGKGGLIARGYYIWNGDDLIGPFTTRNAAWRAAGIEPQGCDFAVQSQRNKS